MADCSKFNQVFARLCGLSRSILYGPHRQRGPGEAGALGLCSPQARRAREGECIRMKIHRIGPIGCGKISVSHIAAIKTLENAALAAVRYRP